MMIMMMMMMIVIVIIDHDDGDGDEEEEEEEGLEEDCSRRTYVTGGDIKYLRGMRRLMYVVPFLFTGFPFV